MMVYNLQSLSQAVSLRKFSTEAEMYAEITGYVQDVLPAFLHSFPQAIKLSINSAFKILSLSEMKVTFVEELSPGPVQVFQSASVIVPVGSTSAKSLSKSLTSGLGLFIYKAKCLFVLYWPEAIVPAFVTEVVPSFESSDLLSHNLDDPATIFHR